MVEVLVADFAVVDEEELNARLDSDDPASGIHEANISVGSEDFGEVGVHLGAHFSAELFDSGEAAVDGFAGGDGVDWVKRGGGGGWDGRGEHGGDFTHGGVGADKVGLVAREFCGGGG